MPVTASLVLASAFAVPERHRYNAHEGIEQERSRVTATPLQWHGREGYGPAGRTKCLGRTSDGCPGRTSRHAREVPWLRTAQRPGSSLMGGDAEIVS
jgi:hypothetical protein